MKLSILYEDNDIVAVFKPAGILTHPDGVLEEETVSDWFAKTYPNSKNVGEEQILKDGTSILRSGIMHRLDRDTSGVLVLAKTPEAHAFLKKAFQEHEVQKTYIALTYGVPPKKEGVIDFPIGRSRKDFRLRSAQPKAKGLLRPAITKYKVLGVFGEYGLIELQPKTGRTHQIRVHLKAVHHPIVCDPYYAPSYKPGLGMERLALHAFQITIPLPQGGTTTIISPLPEDMRTAVAHFPEGAYLLEGTT